MPFTIFPLHGIVRDADGVARCGCGQPSCGSKPGKHPAVAWSKLSPGEQQHGNAGHGIVTGWKSGIFVVDTDGAEADDAFNAMGEIPNTRTVSTPSGGCHYYFKWPGWAVKTGKSVLGPCIDIRGDGGMVVTPGSPHVSGLEYVLEYDDPIADAPAWLLDDPRLKGRIDDAASDKAPTALDPTSPIWDYRVGLGIKACNEWEPHGGTTFFKLAIRLVRDLELPLDTCHELIATHFNPRAVDVDGNPWPWLDKDILHKLTQARDKSDVKPGNASDINLEALAPPKGVDAFLNAIAESKPDAPYDPLNLDNTPLSDADLPIDYLVDGILPRGTVGMFVAQPYALKTWAAYDLAIAVSKGKPWLGRYPTKKGNVVLVDFEMGKRQLRKRLRMLGGDESIRRAIDPPKLLEPETWGALYELQPALIIIDSLSAGNRVAEEKDPKFALPLDYAKKLANACDCAVIFIHHTVKDTSGKAKQAWVRGSGAIFGALDVCYSFEVLPAGAKGEKRASVECIKMRQGEEPKPFAIQLTDARGVELFVDEERAQMASITGNLTDAIRLEIGKRGPASGRDLAAKGRLGRRVADVNAELAAMKDRGEAVFIDRKWHLDGPTLRTERIIRIATDQEIDQSMICTPAKLAVLAHAGVDDVISLLASKQLMRTSETQAGNWFVPEGVAK